MYISVNVNDIVYSCKVSYGNVNNNGSAARCDICQSWIHVKFDKINHIDYKYFKAQIISGTLFLNAVKFPFWNSNK